jgi:cyclase
MKPYLQALLLILCSSAAPAILAQTSQAPALRTTKLTDGLYLLQGNGGNVAVSVGKDGVLLVDDLDDKQLPQIRTAVAALTDKPVRFVINTHWHPDHTGSNQAFGAADVPVIAHENARKRLSADQFNEVFKQTVKAAPPVAWPVITFTNDLTIHFNDEEIQVRHLPAGHTDGDAVVYFRRANVLHTGDLFFNGVYPVIDTASGGTLDGLLGATERILAMLRPETRLIPGHGPLATAADLQEFRRMLSATGAEIGRLVKEGKTLNQIINAKPTRAFDEKWGRSFLPSELYVHFVYLSLAQQKRVR